MKYFYFNFLDLITVNHRPSRRRQHPQPDSVPDEPAPGDERDDVVHVVQPVPRLQGGAARPRTPRHRLRRVRERDAERGRQGRPAGVQDHAHDRDEDFLREKVITSSSLQNSSSDHHCHQDVMIDDHLNWRGS